MLRRLFGRTRERAIMEATSLLAVFWIAYGVYMFALFMGSVSHINDLMRDRRADKRIETQEQQWRDLQKKLRSW